jgi:purine nucleosidase
MTDLIIDSDTASDDAIALIMAMRHPGHRVLAITTVAGNCDVDQATRNALYTTDLCGADVMVARGAERPLEVESRYATWFHGNDGLGDRGYPDPKRRPSGDHGVDVLIQTAIENPGAVLVTLGPLTNVALALERAPEIAASISRCVIMGGTANSVGNVTPAAEFNLWFDPHAAAKVFRSDLPITMAPWDICRGPAGLDAAEQAELRAIGTEIAHFMLDCNATALAAIKEQSGSDTLELPDPTAMAVALDPEHVVARSGHHHVEIEHTSALTRGMSVVDSLEVTGRPANTTVVWEIDVARFKSMVFDAAR